MKAPLVTSLTVILLRGLAILFGGASVVALYAMLENPNNRGGILVPAITCSLVSILLWYWSSSPARQVRALAHATAGEKLLQCQCCDFYSIANAAPGIVCSVCGWRQTDVGLTMPDQHSKSNEGLSLREARANILKIGVSSPKHVSTVLPVVDRAKYRYGQRRLNDAA